MLTKFVSHKTHKMSREKKAIEFLRKVKNIFSDIEEDEEDWKLFLATIIRIQKVQRW